MQTSAQYRPGSIVPVAITAAIAVLGTAVLLFIAFSPDRAPDGVGMRSATAAYLAGATITPSAPDLSSPPVPVDRKN